MFTSIHSWLIFLHLTSLLTHSSMTHLRRNRNKSQNTRNSKPKRINPNHTVSSFLHQERMVEWLMLHGAVSLVLPCLISFHARPRFSSPSPQGPFFYSSQTHRGSFTASLLSIQPRLIPTSYPFSASLFLPVSPRPIATNLQRGELHNKESPDGLFLMP